MDKHSLTQVGRALKELGVQMIPAYSPQARGRSERNFGTWQGRLPQELLLAGIDTLEEANRFLRERYIDVFNRKFTVAAEQKGSAFRRCSRLDLDWVFTVQTERIAAKDNTVAIGERVWQIEKSRFRSTLAGCTVTIHEHLDGCVSLRYGPHVVGRFDKLGNPISNRKSADQAKAESACGSKEVESPFPVSPLGKAGAGGFPPRRKHATRQRKALARIDAGGSPHKRAAAPL